MVKIFSSMQGTKANLDNQAAKSTVEAAQHAAAGNISKSAQAKDVAARANVASAQMSRQIAESNK